MRPKDYFQIFVVGALSGFIFSIVFSFIWTDAYKAVTNSFWISWFVIGLLSSPIGYRMVERASTCSQCGKSFSLSENGQTDIENFLKYRSEYVTENRSTVFKPIPYNVRRYYQHMKCDNCGYEYKYETKSETKA